MVLLVCGSFGWGRVARGFVRSAGVVALGAQNVETRPPDPEVSA